MLYRICSNNSQLFPLLRLLLTDFFNILKVVCKIILKQNLRTFFHAFIQILSLLSPKDQYQTLQKLNSEPFIQFFLACTIFLFLFFLDKQGRVSLHLIARLIRRFYVTVGKQQFFPPTVSCTHRLVSFRQLPSLIHCHSL